MLKNNTFRSDRYLRSKFTEGSYLLSSELGDVELEILDTLRRTVQKLVGDIAIDDAFKVSRFGVKQLLIEPGEAWQRGLPFSMRSSSDQLVSGAAVTIGGTSLSIGIVPAGVTIEDSPTGEGKILTFTAGSTPTALYRIVVSAKEEIITDTQDPFLKNANITEATGQKVRLLLQINIVTESTQTETPVPYTPDTGIATVANLVNQIVISPAVGLNGEVTAVTPLSGSEQIDGRNLELTVTNDPGLGSGIPIPQSSTDQQVFYNGKLIDSVGAEYHINAIFTDGLTVKIRLDKEYGQPYPQILNGSTYTLIKRDVYVTDDTTGNPLGTLFWPIANADWSTTEDAGFVHPSSVTDLRRKIVSDEQFQAIINQKINLVPVGGGTIGVDTDGETLHWTSNFTLINPVGLEQQILSNSGVVVTDGGCLAYFLDLTGGTISKGNLAVTSTTNGTTISFSGGPNLSTVSKGNTIRIGTEIASILSIDNFAKSVVVDTSITSIGSGTIFKDSYASGSVPGDANVFILAARKGSVFIVGNALELSAGMSNAIYDESIDYSTGYTANTDIVLPVNTRNSNKDQYFSSTKGQMVVYINQLPKEQGIDWTVVDSQTIRVTYNLPNDSSIRFRIDSLPSGSIGGGSGAAGSLQAAYNIGPTITTITGIPVTVNGPALESLLDINGDMTVTGVIL